MSDDIEIDWNKFFRGLRSHLFRYAIRNRNWPALRAALELWWETWDREEIAREGTHVYYTLRTYQKWVPPRLRALWNVALGRPTIYGCHLKGPVHMLSGEHALIVKNRIEG